MRRTHRFALALGTGALLFTAPALAADDAATGTMPEMDTHGEMQNPPAEPPPAETGPAMDEATEPSQSQQPSTSAASGTEYTVEKGDTLAEIAEKELGSQDKWQAIARANGLEDPDMLQVGQKLRIPRDEAGASMKQSRL